MKVEDKAHANTLVALVLLKKAGYVLYLNVLLSARWTGDGGM